MKCEQKGIKINVMAVREIAGNCIKLKEFKVIHSAIKFSNGTENPKCDLTLC